jgi:hypothetical protein
MELRKTYVRNYGSIRVEVPASSGTSLERLTASMQRTAELFLQHWPFPAPNTTGMRHRKTLTVLKYRPAPFLELMVPGVAADSDHELVGGFIAQLHEKDYYRNEFWLDILPGEWVEPDQEELLENDDGEYERPGALLHMKYEFKSTE